MRSNDAELGSEPPLFLPARRCRVLPAHTRQAAVSCKPYPPWNCTCAPPSPSDESVRMRQDLLHRLVVDVVLGLEDRVPASPRRPDRGMRRSRALYITAIANGLELQRLVLLQSRLVYPCSPTRSWKTRWRWIGTDRSTASMQLVTHHADRHRRASYPHPTRSGSDARSRRPAEHHRRFFMVKSVTRFGRRTSDRRGCGTRRPRRRGRCAASTCRRCRSAARLL